MHATDAPGPLSSGNTGDRTLYVGNLPFDAAQADLEAVFAEHGVAPVVRIHLPVGPDGRMRGFGFVTMGSAEAANEAITALRGVEMKGRGLMINVAHPRGAPGSGGGDRPSFGGGFDRGGPPRAAVRRVEAIPISRRRRQPMQALEETAVRPVVVAVVGRPSQAADWDKKKKKRGSSIRLGPRRGATTARTGKTGTKTGRWEPTEWLPVEPL